MRISDWSSDVCSSDLPLCPLLQLCNYRSRLSGQCGQGGQGIVRARERGNYTITDGGCKLTVSVIDSIVNNFPSFSISPAFTMRDRLLYSVPIPNGTSSSAWMSPVLPTPPTLTIARINHV